MKVSTVLSGASLAGTAGAIALCVCHQKALKKHEDMLVSLAKNVAYLHLKELKNTDRQAYEKMVSRLSDLIPECRKETEESE